MTLSGISCWRRKRRELTPQLRDPHRYFSVWCLPPTASEPLPALPKTLARYSDSVRAAGTPAVHDRPRRAAAVRPCTLIAGLLHAQPGPTPALLVKATVRGIRRSVGTAPAQKTALVAKQIGRMLETCDGNRLLDRRDQAPIALGFGAGLAGGSELVALEGTGPRLRRARPGPQRIRRSKGDQEGHGAVLAVPHGDVLLPVQAVQDWLTSSGITTGPLFVLDR